MTLDQIDKTGLIREAYKIEGVSQSECRSIFIDWALKLPPGISSVNAIRILLAEYANAAGAEDHPMTEVLKAGLNSPPTPRRRGGRKGRLPQA